MENEVEVLPVGKIVRESNTPTHSHIHEIES